jgi:hypothetical protein
LFPTRVERQEKTGVMSRLLGQQPARLSRDQVTFIAITPRKVQ